MAKHHKIANAQKLHRKNRRKNWEKIERGISAERERKERIKQLEKAQKTVDDVRKKAIENAEKDKIKLAKKKILVKKEVIKQIKKRTTKNGETK